MLEAEDAGSPEPCTCLSLKPREGQRPGPFWEREPQRVGVGGSHTSGIPPKLCTPQGRTGKTVFEMSPRKPRHIIFARVQEAAELATDSK